MTDRSPSFWKAADRKIMPTFLSLKLSLRPYKFIHKAVAYPLLVFWVLMFFTATPGSGSEKFEKLKPLIGHNDSLVVADPEGRILFSKNHNNKLVPASILKIFTSLGAFHYLGPDYRYPTEIYLDTIQI